MALAATAAGIGPEPDSGTEASVALRRRTRSTYGAVLGAAVLCYAALGAVLPALPRFAGIRLHGGPVAVGLAVGAPSLSGAFLRPLGGRFADRSGPFSVLLAGAVLMAVGVVPAFVPALPALIGSRLLVGGGEALMMSAAVLWLLRLAGPARRARAVGHAGLANYAGLTVGPLLADAIGPAAHLDRLWAAAAALPLLGGAVAAACRAEQGGPLRGRAEAPVAGGSGTAPLARLTLRPGMGLLLVNVGYVAVLSFGATAAAAHGIHIAALIVPIFGVGVIVSRTLFGSLPDRLGGARTLTGAALLEALGLVVAATTRSEPLAVLGLLALALGQGVAVPSLGLLALSRVEPGRQGAAAGLFFAYFDAGVGLGGPLVGMAARAFGAPAALLVAAVAVAAAIPAALLRAGAGDAPPRRRGVSAPVGDAEGPR